MFVTTACNGCQRPLRVRPSAAGGRVRCPGCGAGLVVGLSANGPGGATDKAGPEPVPVHSAPAEAVRPPSGVLRRVGTTLAVLLPLGLPVLTRGGVLGFALGAGLAGLTGLLALRRRWTPRVGGAVLGVDGLAYALVLFGLFGRAPSGQATAEGEGPRPAGLAAGPTRRGLGPRPPAIVPRAESVALVGRKPSGNHLHFTRNLGGLLSLAVAPAQGAAFATGADGSLRVYSYPAFRLRATYTLARP